MSAIPATGLLFGEYNTQLASRPTAHDSVVTLRFTMFIDQENSWHVLWYVNERNVPDAEILDEIEFDGLAKAVRYFDHLVEKRSK